MGLGLIVSTALILGFLTHIIYKMDKGDGNIVALIDVVNDIKGAIQELAARVAGLEPGKVAELEALIAEERAAHEAYVAAEDAEDVEQNQRIADAEAAVDAKLAEIADAETALAEVKTQVEEIAATPVVEEPVEEPAEPEAPVEEPAEELPFEEAPAETEEPAVDPAVDTEIPYEGEAVADEDRSV